MGTRRAEELIKEARSLAYQENYSLTEGWNDNTLVDILNLGLDKLYAAITQIDNPAEIEEVRIDSVANQQAYDLPVDVHMALRVADVRYLYGTTDYQFQTLVNSSIQQRYAFPGNIPQIYTIRNGQILLSPTPSSSREGVIVVNYQKRMRKLDIRRGKIASRTLGPPVTFTVDFTSSSQKNANLRANGESVLDLIDRMCIVDFEGNPIVNNVPIESYNQSTQVITCQQDYSIPSDEQTALDDKIADGNDLFITSRGYSSTHSELDVECESSLIEYAVLRLLRLQSESGGTAEQLALEEETISRLITQYRRSRPTVYRANIVSGRNSRNYPYWRGRY